VEPSESISFCGFTLKGGKCSPEPKNPIEFALINKELEKFSDGDFAAQQQWTRSWAGRFQYYRDFLAPKDRVIELDTLYDFMKLSQEDMSPEHLENVKTSFVKLVDQVLNRIALPFGHIKTLKCILLIDANCQSWGGILLRCIADPDDKFKCHERDWLETDPDQFLHCAIDDIRRVIIDSGLTMPFTLLPVKIIGGIFTARQQRHSST
jgi:hypothetical protein